MKANAAVANFLWACRLGLFLCQEAILQNPGVIAGQLFRKPISMSTLALSGTTALRQKNLVSYSGDC